MTPDHIRNLLGGYATGTLTDQEKKLLFEAALEDQELFEAIAAEDSMRELLDDPESRGYLLEALEEGPRTGSAPMAVNPPAPAPASRARAQKMDMAKAEAMEGSAAAPPDGARPAGPIRQMPAPKPAPPPVAMAQRGNWMRNGAIAASAVILFGVSVWGVKQLDRTSGTQVASVPAPSAESPAPVASTDRATPEPDANKSATAAGSQPLKSKAISDSVTDKATGGSGVAEGRAQNPLLRDEEQAKLSKDDVARRDQPAERAAPAAAPQPVQSAPAPPAPARQEERKAEVAASRQQVELNAVAPEVPQVSSQNMDAVGQQQQQQQQQRNANVQQQIATMTPDGARPGDASALYFQQQQNTGNARQGALLRMGEASRAVGAEQRSREVADERAKRRTVPLAPAPGAAAPKPATPAKEAVGGSGETPGVRYEVQRKDEQGRWNVVSAAAGFKVGDEIALRVEQNVAGDVRVIYQDQSLRPVALALLADGAAKRTAPFKLAAPGIAQFTIVLRGPATGTAIPTAPPSSQVVEAEGPTNYVVRPNAPANAPVVAQISLTVR